MKERITRGKAIRLKCLDCCCGSAVEVRKCEKKDCTLWPFRMYGTSSPKTTANIGGLPENNSGV